MAGSPLGSIGSIFNSMGANRSVNKTDPPAWPAIEDGFLKDDGGLRGAIENFMAIGPDYIRDMEPNSQNLFYAGFFSGDDAEVEVAPFRIQRVSIGMPAFATVTDPYTRIVNIDKVALDQTVKISWLEDVARSVQKYHYDWSLRWYNRRYDVLRTGIEGKFRKLAVVGFHFMQDQPSTEFFIAAPAIEPIYAVLVGGIVPEDFGQFEWGYASDGNDTTLDVSYKASKIEWYYYKNYGPGPGTDPDSKGTSWKPKGINLTPGKEPNKGEESLQYPWPGSAVNKRYENYEDKT